MSNSNEDLLKAALAVAVPLWQRKIKQDFDWYWAQKDQMADVLAHRCDVLYNKSSIKGESAKIFGECAKAVALLSFAPGGVTILGQTYIGHLDHE